MHQLVECKRAVKIRKAKMKLSENSRVRSYHCHKSLVGDYQTDMLRNDDSLKAISAVIPPT